MAYLIDSVIYLAGMFVLGIVLGIVVVLAGVEPETERFNTVVQIFSYIIAIPTGWLYWALMESSDWQATLGKKALGLVVTDEQGAQISFGRATGRYFARIVSGLTLLIGFVMAGFTEKKQALHDMIAGCLVVRRS